MNKGGFSDVEWKLNWDWWVKLGGVGKSVQEKWKNYPDWKKSVFVEMMVVSCSAAEIKGEEDL